LKQTVTLLESDDQTMLSSWSSEIAARNTSNGGCILMAWVFCSDLPRGGATSYRSGIIQTAQGFLRAWDKCCDALGLDGAVDDAVVKKVEEICPELAKALRLHLEKLEAD
jgi:hypothetical protein